MRARNGEHVLRGKIAAEERIRRREAIAQAIAEIELGSQGIFPGLIADPAPQALHPHARSALAARQRRAVVRGFAYPCRLAEIGREQQGARDVAGMVHDIGERADAAQGDADEPDLAVAAAARRQHDILGETRE